MVVVSNKETKTKSKELIKKAMFNGEVVDGQHQGVKIREKHAENKKQTSQRLKSRTDRCKERLPYAQAKLIE